MATAFPKSYCSSCEGFAFAIDWALEYHALILFS